MTQTISRFFIAISFFMAFTGQARGEEFYCEVMALEGMATLTNDSVSEQALKEGDVLKAEDVVQVGPDSYVDLAYDREWNNVTRVEENSKIRIHSLYPAEVELVSGGIFAKLRSLPKESSFSVTTPTAIASVRGTEYRTTFLEGETQIYNLSDSDVFVYGLDSAGQAQATPVVIRHSEKTQVVSRGQAPVAARRMESHELQRAEHFRQGIEKRVNENIAKGHFGKIQDVKTMERARPEHNSRVPALSGDQADRQPLVSREGEGGERRRAMPMTLSGEEARQATDKLVGRDAIPAQNEAGTLEGSGENHRPVEERGSSRLLESANAPSTAEPANIAHGQKAVGAQQQGNPAGQMTRRPNNKEAARGVRGQQMREQKNSSGQPFGPDPGRRPQDGTRRTSAANQPNQPNQPSQPQPSSATKPAPRPTNQV